MANDDKRLPGDPSADDDANLSSQARLEKVLATRWDPGKMSKFMRQSSSSRGTKLDATHRSRFEKRLGVDLGNVRIFTGELAEEITSAHGAEALTVGDTGMILMRQSSKFTPGSAAGTALLAHELTHVAQARPDAVSRKTTASQGNVEASEQEAEEHEADVLDEEQRTGGAGRKGPSEAEKGDKEDAKKAKLVAMVLEIMEEDEWLTGLRSGSRPVSLF